MSDQAGLLQDCWKSMEIMLCIFTEGQESEVDNIAQLSFTIIQVMATSSSSSFIGVVGQMHKMELKIQETRKKGEFNYSLYI